MKSSGISRTWAIDLNLDVDPGPDGFRYVGIHWWFRGIAPNLPAHVRGFRAATFETRSEARAALAEVKASWPLARVVRIEIEVRQCP